MKQSDIDLHYKAMEYAANHYTDKPHVADFEEAWLAGYEEAEDRIKHLEQALKDITTRGRGNGGCVVINTETLRSIAKEALKK